MTTNPVADVFRFSWTPSDYTPRTVSFMTDHGTGSQGRSSAVYIITGSTTRVVANSQSAFEGVQFIVVPSPGAAAAIAAGVFAAHLRRTRRELRS